MAQAQAQAWAQARTGSQAPRGSQAQTCHMVTGGGRHLGFIAAWRTSSLANALSPPFPSIESFIEPLSSSTRAKSIGVAQ